MKKLWLFCFVSGMIICTTNCGETNKSASNFFDYGTQIDSARQYYLQGWSKIMDEGRWTESESAFRKAIEIDDQFVLGKLLVGRISNDLEEREEILKEVEKKENTHDEAEELLIEIYKNSVSFMNLREKGEQITPEMRVNKDSVSEVNHRRFLSLYPEAIYEKAEYIEILHHKYGAQVAIDSLRQLTDDNQKTIPFFISYKAILEAELGNFGRSGELIIRMDSLVDENAPARYFTRASVYEAMDSLAYAKAMAEQAFQLDTNHLLAKGLLQRLRLRESRHRDEEM